MVEEWKDIKGFEGLYQVSNCGNVRSLSRDKQVYSTRWNTYYIRHTKEKELKKHFNDGKHSYYIVVLHDSLGNARYPLIHRLVAEAFIPNPDGLPEINHKDENKLNNCVDNLEWCTHKYNSNYGTRNMRTSEHRRGKCTGENHPRYGKSMSDEQRQKISKSLKLHFAKNESHRKGKTFTDEQRENVRKGAIQGWKNRKLRDEGL